jgi:V8-like Glu-specific endopeptidase
MTYSASSYPYDTVVRVTDTIGSQSWQGSGVLISPDEVLTASHVVYIQGVGTANDIVVTPGYSDGASPYGSADGTYIHYFPINDANRSVTNQQSQDDYAVIHLATPFASAGYMGLESNFPGGAVNITGYPASAGGAQVDSSQTVTRDPSYTLLDGTALGEGSSGGPVWIETAGGPSVVGVVSSESNASTTGYNTLITTAAFTQIEAWLQQDGSRLGTVPDTTTNVAGAHSQYNIADDNGSLYIQDLVPGRDGTQILPANTQIDFTDGTGVFDPTGNAEEVARLYQAALDRAPDVGGLDGWTAQLNAQTLGIVGVALGFINSAEFSSKYGMLDNSDFVTQLYQNVLHRAPDSAGEQGWTNQLNGGVSRAQVLIGFSDSLENKLDTQGTIGDPNMDEAYRLYQAALDRAPDMPGLGGWTAQLDNGATPLQVAQGFVSSNEFTQLFAGLDTKGFVDQLYQNVLHRAPDSAGEQGWINQLNSGVSKAQVVLGFSDSLENRVDTSQATHDSWVFIPS